MSPEHKMKHLLPENLLVLLFADVTVDAGLKLLFGHVSIFVLVLVVARMRHRPKIDDLFLLHHLDEVI